MNEHRSYDKVSFSQGGTDVNSVSIRGRDSDTTESLSKDIKEWIEERYPELILKVDHGRITFPFPDQVKLQREQYDPIMLTAGEWFTAMMVEKKILPIADPAYAGCYFRQYDVEPSDGDARNIIGVDEVKTIRVNTITDVGKKGIYIKFLSNSQSNTITDRLAYGLKYHLYVRQPGLKFEIGDTFSWDKTSSLSVLFEEEDKGFFGLKPENKQLVDAIKNWFVSHNWRLTSSDNKHFEFGRSVEYISNGDPLDYRNITIYW